MQVRKQQLELDMEQQTGSKSGKKYIKASYCHPAYLMYMQIHHAKCGAGWSAGWNQDCGRNINNLTYADDITLMAESEEELKSLLIKVKEDSEKTKKTKIMASGPITSWQLEGETMETVTDFIFWGLQNLCIWWLQPWN